MVLLLSAAVGFGASCSDSGVGSDQADRFEQGVTMAPIAVKVGVAGRTSMTTDPRLLPGAGGSAAGGDMLAFKKPTSAPAPVFKANECASLEDGEQALQHRIAMFALSFVKAIRSLEMGLVLETNVSKGPSGELYLVSNGCQGITLSDRARELAYDNAYDIAWAKYEDPPPGFLEGYTGTRKQFAEDAAQRATTSLAVQLSALQQSGDGCEVADALRQGFQSPLCSSGAVGQSLAAAGIDPGCAIELEPVNDANGQPKTFEHMCKQFEVFKVKASPGAAPNAVEAAKTHLLSRFGEWKGGTNPYIVFDGLSTQLAADEIGLDPFSAENTDCWFKYPDQHYCYSQQHDYLGSSPHILPGPYLVASPERRCDPCTWEGPTGGIGKIRRYGTVYKCDLSLTCMNSDCNCLQ